jgi:hypothetical protein
LRRHTERYGEPLRERNKDPLKILIQRESGTCASCEALDRQEWMGTKKYVCRKSRQKGSADIAEMRRCREYIETGRSTVGVKEKIVSAAQSKDLAWHAEFEKAIDRLTAFGMSDPLGAALWRFKYLRDRAAFKKAMYLLADKAEERIKKPKSKYLFGLVAGVMCEWALDLCQHCNGTGLLASPGAPTRTVKCTKCEGSGLKMYSDWERSNNCGLKGAWNPGHQKNFDEVMICLTGATAATGGRVNELLKNAPEML